MSSKEKLLASAQKNVEKGQIAKAIKDYQEVVKADPKDIRTRQKLAELLSRNRMIDDALSEYGAVAKYYANDGFYLKAIAVYKQMQKLDPARPEIYNRLAELNEKQGLIGNAIAEYQNLLKFYEQKKMHSEAVQVLQKVKDLDPENLNVRTKLAEAYIHSRQKEKAREEICEIRQTLGGSGDQARLLKFYEFFLPLFPDDHELRIGYAEALIRRGDADRGIHALKDLLKKNPESSDILRALAQGYHLARDFQNERLTYQHLLKNQPDDLDLRQAHVRACLDLGEHARALAELEEWKEAFCGAGKVELLKGFYGELKTALPKEPRVAHALKVLSGGGKDLQPAPRAEAVSPPAAESDAEVAVDDLLGGALLEEAAEDLVEVEDLEEIAEIVEEEPALTEPSFPDAVAEPDLEEIPLGFLEAPEEELPVGPAADPGLELELELDLSLDDSVSLETEIPPAASLELTEAEEDLELIEPDEEILSLEEEIEPEPEVESILELEPPAEEPETTVAAPLGSDETAVLSLDTELPLDTVYAPDTDIRAELEEAEFYLHQALFAEAEQICRELLKKHPRQAEVLAMLTQIEEQRGLEVSAPKEEFYDLGAAVLDDAESALGNLGETVAPDFTPSATPPQKRAVKTEVEVEDPESHYHLGIAYKEMGLLDEAVTEFDQAMRAPSRAIDCLLLKGICLVEKGKFEGAEEVFRAGLARPELGESEKISIHFEMGVLYQAWGRPPDALENFQFVAEHDPFFRNVGELVTELRQRLGFGAGKEGEGATGKGKNRVSYV